MKEEIKVENLEAKAEETPIEQPTVKEEKPVEEKIVKVESMPNMEGKKMIIMLAPKKPGQAKKEKKEEAKQNEKDSRRRLHSGAEFSQMGACAQG